MAALSRKFFIDLAHRYRDAAPPSDAAQLRAMWLHCVTVTASAIAQQSAQFNHERFYEACGVADHEVLTEA
jgi:hypothetical protein